MLVAVYPPQPSSELAEALLLAGVDTVSVAEQPQADDWAVAVFELADQPAAALRTARGLVEDLGVRVLVVVGRNQAGLLPGADFVSDFVLNPPDPVELRVRLARLSKLQYVPRPWAEFRLHAVSKTIQNDQQAWDEMLRVHRREGGSWFAPIVAKYWIRRLVAPLIHARRRRLLDQPNP